MARGLNKVTLIGNLGADPEERHGANGNTVTRINVATTESWNDRDTGDREERTEWHRVVFFGRVAEVAAQYLKKGSKVYIEGTLRTSSYEKDGQTRYSTDVIAREMLMLDGRGDDQAPVERAAAAPTGTTPAQQPESAPADAAWRDDDIPF